MVRIVLEFADDAVSVSNSLTISMPAWSSEIGEVEIERNIITDAGLFTATKIVIQRDGQPEVTVKERK